MEQKEEHIDLIGIWKPGSEQGCRAGEHVSQIPRIGKLLEIFLDSVNRESGKVIHLRMTTQQCS